MTDDWVFSFDFASAVEMCIKKCATVHRKEMWKNHLNFVLKKSFNANQSKNPTRLFYLVFLVWAKNVTLSFHFQRQNRFAVSLWHAVARVNFDASLLLLQLFLFEHWLVCVWYALDKYRSNISSFQECSEHQRLIWSKFHHSAGNQLASAGRNISVESHASHSRPPWSLGCLRRKICTISRHLWHGENLDEFALVIEVLDGHRKCEKYVSNDLL